ncbi:MAG: hypothetical protein KAS32_12665 [Candidatus Peribacteraceae bacterium]|nr:hypothetical protein [Candidatus Peribacteraceae bacterium]
MIRKYIIIALLIFLPTLAQGEENGNNETSTESATPKLEETKWQERIEKSKDFRLAMMKTWKETESLFSFAQNYWNKQKENAIKCKKDLRKSNKLTLFSTKVRCFRNNIVDEKEYWEKHLEYSKIVVGISEESKTNLEKLISDLVDAISAIENGIDTDVYKTEEDLLEAKQNLHSLYRLPVRKALIKSYAERNSTWTSHILVRLNTELEQELSEENINALNEVISCFTSTEPLFEAIPQEEELKSLVSTWITTKKASTACIQQMEDGLELF